MGKVKKNEKRKGKENDGEDEEGIESGKTKGSTKCIV